MTEPLAGRIVTPAGVVEGALVLDGDRIAAVRARAGDVPDRWLVPGFVDLHVHGGGGADVMDGPEPGAAIAAVAAFHLGRGTTALCPTTVARPWPELARTVAAAGALARAEDEVPRAGARVLGVHLEGPFLAPARRGAQPDALAPIDDAALAALEGVLAAGPVATVTLAPELPGALEVVRRLRARGVRASLGHSAAGYEEARAAFAAGAAGVTHLFNAMSGLGHRAPGLAAAALEAEGAALELILDGHHVHPALARLALRAARGPVCLVTDAIRAAGRPDGPSELGGQAVLVADGRVTLPDGTLAGSVLTLDEALRRAVAAGLDVPAASALVARNPADALGRPDLGRLAPGARADVVALTADLRVEAVWRSGRRVAPVEA